MPQDPDAWAMSSERAFAICRGWLEDAERRRLTPDERSEFIEREVRALGPDAQRLIRRVLMDIFKRPRPQNDPAARGRPPPRPRG